MSEETALQQALSSYGLENARTRLLQGLWNRVYHIEADDGKQFSLRICSATYRDRSSLEDELIWLAHISSQDQVVVPRPIANIQGNLLTLIETAQGVRFCCLFAWIEGEEAYKHLTLDVMHQIGRAVAILHKIAKEYDFPDDENLFRHNYRFDRTLVASHREWIAVHQAEIGVENVNLLHAAIRWVLAAFEQIGETRQNFGFIHADLHPGNFLVNEGQVSVIDFDQVGRGHYLYDIACLLVELMDDAEQFSTRWACFKQGYQSVTKLPFRQESELEPFIVAVKLAFLDWVYNAQGPNVRKTKMPLVPATYEFIRQHMRDE